ncbi:hypothetical protein ACRAWF_32560 [Streptomyces sp. L7]
MRDLRAAEGAVGQADILLTGVDQLANSSPKRPTWSRPRSRAREAVRARAATGTVDGVPRSLLGDTDAALAAVREELTGDRPYDPLAALRSITLRAVPPLGGGQDGVLGAAAWLVGRGDVRAADGFVATHRGAVGAGRTLLAESERLLGTDPAAAGEPSVGGTGVGRAGRPACTATRTPAAPNTRAEPSSAECCSARIRTAAPPLAFGGPGHPETRGT